MCGRTWGQYWHASRQACLPHSRRSAPLPVRGTAVELHSPAANTCRACSVSVHAGCVPLCGSWCRTSSIQPCTDATCHLRCIMACGCMAALHFTSLLHGGWSVHASTFWCWHHIAAGCMVSRSPFGPSHSCTQAVGSLAGSITALRTNQNAAC